MKQLFLILAIAAVIFTGVSKAQDNDQKIRFSGLMFGDYFNNVARDTNFAKGNLPASALTGRNGMNGFDIRRVYFTMDDDISSSFTTRFRLEADGSEVTTSTTGAGSQAAANTGAVTYQGKLTTFVKDAYLQWKNIYNNASLFVGVQPTPAYDASEAAWGHRDIEKTIMDLRGVIPSRDMGLGLKGKFDDGGMWNYWLMIANGDGNNDATSKYHRYAVTLKAVPDANWIVTLSGDWRSNAPINDPTSTTVPKATVGHDVMTGALFVGYAQKDNFSLGLEGFIASQSNGQVDPSLTTGALTSLSREGISGWGTYNFQSDLQLVARYDYYTPDNNSNISGVSRNYIIGGLAYKPDAKVTITPNVQYESYAAPTGGTAPDASVTARLTFFWVFM